MDDNEETVSVAADEEDKGIKEGTDSGGEEIGFADLGLDEITLRAVERKGFVTPSPIQMLAIPRLLGGDANVIAKARTGTGKTAAFGLPLAQRLRGGSDHVMAIILEPTRELAVQTCNEMQSFTQGRYPRTCVVYGGASYSTQMRELRRGVEIVVGTPGRVQDHMRRGVLDISKIDYFILDEGDEMLDMGFIDDIENIFKEANPSCRVLLFSATMPPAILKIAQKFMGEYEVVEEEGVLNEPLLIEQHYWVVREKEKINALVRLIDSASDFYGLVFTQTKNDADNVCRELDERGYDAAALHGDVPQGQREKILARFRTKRTRVLVATDVAARGIDITGLSHVVNYSLPFDGATYVHRIGRTGRAGAAGIAITFVRPEERRRLRFIEGAIRRSSKGEWSYQDVPSIDDVISIKKERLFEELKRDASKCTDELDVYKEMADRLCDGQNAVEVLTRLIAAVYGSSLDRVKYGEISKIAVQSPKRYDRQNAGARHYGRESSERGYVHGDGGQRRTWNEKDDRGAKRERDDRRERRERFSNSIALDRERGGHARDYEGEHGGGFGGSRAKKFLHGGYAAGEGAHPYRKERPKVHTPTERNAHSGLYKQKKPKERF